ncbi:MAG: efflux RND transporter periplasmic adaptor subunit [gamma proteobacterium symbiont of Ctena orbiculata]|nr:MAG: efflux RND transporter periplasmic adaptor subunit [gamma proteobacterium symbiont of Ctena orbiculata]
MKALIVICLLFSGELIARDLEAVSDWNNRVELTTLVSGMVSRVNVEVGSAVKRGEVLVELDQRRYQSRLAAVESRLEATSQQNEEAKRELDRALELYDRTLLSDHERKQAEIAAAASDASYREAEAKLITIRLQREYSRIAAPFDGIVESIHVQPGQAVINRHSAAPILTLVDNSRMKAVAEVDEQTALGLRPGMAVDVGVRGEWLDGTVNLLGLNPVARDAGGSRYRLEALFTPSMEMAIRAGEKVVVRLNDE